jgi:serine/threonine-protein kinase RsbW
MQDQIKVGCSIGNLKIIRQFVRSFFNRIEVSEIERDMIILAIDEVCSNAIIHGNANNSEKEIEINIQNHAHAFEIHIKDQGVYHNPLQHQETAISNLIDEQHKGGMGLMLVKRIMDSIHYTRDLNTNVFSMTKYIA